MPQRDSIHNIVSQALQKDGWEITDDPYVISYGRRFLFIDLGVSEPHSQPQSTLIGARQHNQRIAIEIKEFRGNSAIADLEQAIGQYVLYQLLLQQVDTQRQLYLAITTKTFATIFTEPIGQLVIRDLPLKLLVIDTNTTEVTQWIPPIPAP
jgi:XisH protein